MGIIDTIKSFFCKHDYTILNINPLERKGTLIITLRCKKCKQGMPTFHDFTETEELMFRNPKLEELMLKEGYLKIGKNGKYTLSFRRTSPTIKFAK